MSIPSSSPRVKLRHLILGVFGLFVMLGATLAITPADAEAQPGIIEFHTHACINSDTVQSQAAASGLSVGNTFITDNYESFIIVKCTFDSSACDATLNLYLVDDVATCLAQGAADAGSTAGIAGDAGADASPAASGSGSASSLAHTGEEHELAGAFAAALIGAGFAALGLSRRRNQ
jgi:hypothetical protein